MKRSFIDDYTFEIYLNLNIYITNVYFSLNSWISKNRRSEVLPRYK